MRFWVELVLTVVGFLSVLGLIALQLSTRTTLTGPTRPIHRDERPALYWTIVGFQLFLVVASGLLMVAQVQLGM